MITAQTSSIFRLAFNKSLKISLFSLLLSVDVRSSAETLRGVVYADSSGASAAGSGMVRLTVGNRVDDYYYSKPLQRKFSNSVCLDIGAVWTIEVRRATDIVGAECKGEVDEWVHEPWLIIKELFDRLRQRSPSTFELFSSRWRGSSDYRPYADMLRNLNLSGYSMFGRPGGCLEVTRTDHMGPTQIQTGDCHLQVGNKGVDFSFDVVRNKVTNRFEIDRIQVD